MKVTRFAAICAVSEGAAIFSTRTAYASAQNPVLFREYAELAVSDTFGDHYTQRSEDNGLTWSTPERFFPPGANSRGNTAAK